MQRLLAALATTCATTFALAQGPHPGFTYQTVARNLASAVSMAFAPDGRLFLAERLTGHIRVIQDGVLLPSPWATVATSATTFDERGFVGIAIDPDFLTNHYVYVFYTNATQTENVIGRFEEVAGSGQNFTILTPPGALPAAPAHNGGVMVFGADGRLYVATGDRLNQALPQSPSSWAGKILRFSAPGLGIPADNPIPGSAVYSLGHRNTFGLAVHPVTGELFQCENGWVIADEVNVVLPGRDYGWPTVEGGEPVPNAALEDPLYVWAPQVAPVGMSFYTGENYPPTYRNQLFLADNGFNQLWNVRISANGRSVLGASVIDDRPGYGFGAVMAPDGNIWYLGGPNSATINGDEVGRYVHQNEPNPSANVMAVSNKSVGGSITYGFHARNGDILYPWASFVGYQTPVPTPYGNQWVPTEVPLGLRFVSADDRAYLALAVPNQPALIGTVLHGQAAAIDGTTFAIRLSNQNRITLR
jgi:glucose/arabinose dehydrogenase